MTTLVKGLPVMAGTTPLSISIEYDAPYQGGATGLGASLRVYKGTWNPGTTRWEDSTGAELAIPLPRPDQPDVALKGGLTARITHGTGQNIKTTVFPVSTYQTAPGVLDLTVDPAPLDLVAAPALQSLLADLPTLKAELQVETVNAREGGEDAYYFASVANLAANTAFDAAGMKGVPLQSDIPALKGFYILTDPSVVGQVYEKATDAAAPVRRADRERPSAAEVTRLSTAVGHTTSASLSAVATTAGRQFYDGRSWIGSATNATDYLPSADGKYWRPERDPLLSSLDGVTARYYGADPTEAVSSTTAITSALAAGVGRLGAGSFKLTAGLSIPKGSVLRGENAASTTLRADLPGGSSAVQTAAVPAINEYDGHVLAVSGLTIDGTGGANRAANTGLRFGGAYRTVRDVRVKEWGVGVKFDQNHTYLSLLESFSIHACVFGVVWEAGTTDSGENIRLRNGVIGNNVHNLYIKSPDWFITVDGVSLDYPTTTQILSDGKVSLNIVNGHVEHAASGIALVNTTAANTDMGVIVFRDTRFVNSAKPLSVANDLIGGNVRSVALVFLNCMDEPSAERFTRVVWRMPGLPTTAPTTGTPWLNTTGVTVRVRTRWTLTPTAGADAVVEAYSGPGTAGLPLRGALFASRGTQAHTEFLTLDVPVGHSIGYGFSAAPFVSIEFEPLPF